MPKQKVHHDLHPIRHAGSKPKGKEVGSFIMVVIAAVAALLFFRFLGFINELFLLLGIIAIMLFVKMNTPPFLMELKQYERAVVLRYGRFLKVAGPGWATLLPLIDDARIVDLRVMVTDITPQEVVTKDNIKLKIDAIVYMKITDPKSAVINVQDPMEASRTYVQAHLRDIIGKMELEAVISDIHIINELLHSGLAKVTHDWGVEVVKVEIQSIELPDVVMNSMHDRKAAEQKKHATEEMAKGQAIQIDAIRQAAGKLESPALQYLYLEALQKVAEGRSSKIIFPLELTHLADRLSGSMSPNQRSKVEDDLRGKYDEFLLEETRDGVPLSKGDILKTLKRKADRKLKKGR